MKFVYEPNGVCSNQFNFEIEDNKIKSLEVIGGCNGNLQGISSLLKEMDINNAIERLEGIKCGFKNTSCPDQIAQALKSFLNKQ